MSATERQRNQLFDRLAPIVEQLGYDLDDISVARVGRRSLLKVIVDGDHGVDLDAIAELSHAIGAAVDAEDPFETPYVLEVSSPGVDRPLTAVKHWRRNAGRLVETVAAGQPLRGRIMSVEGADDASAVVVIAGDAGVRSIPFTALGPGRIQVEFGHHAPGPGESPSAASSADEEV